MALVNHVENGITLQLKGNHAIPRTSGTFFNPKMQVNRCDSLAAKRLSSKLLDDVTRLTCRPTFAVKNFRYWERKFRMWNFRFRMCRGTFVPWSGSYCIAEHFGNSVSELCGIVYQQFY